LYTFYLIITAQNHYYCLLYVFLEIVYFGVFLATYQMELFTGFLWVAEFTSVFIALLLLFYLNVIGDIVKQNYTVMKFIFLGPVSGVLFFNLDYPSELEFFLPTELYVVDLWDDFYEAVYNSNMNDFSALYLSYYVINSFEFLIIGFFLLIGSIVAVNLYKLTKYAKVDKYSTLFEIFDFFKDSVDYIFMRKQNTTKQSNQPAATKIFKKK
jgi:hypothetical protein